MSKKAEGPAKTAKAAPKPAKGNAAPKAARSSTDWEAIERDYRAGVKSIREVAKIHGVSDTAIRKKATSGAWTRDLSARVGEQARIALVRDSVRTANPQTEQEIVDDAAGQIVAVVRSHRKRINLQTELVDVLTQQLIDVAGNRSDFEDEIDDLTAEDKSGERRAKLMRAVSLPTHATTAGNLANALKTLIGLQRQAYSISDQAETATNPLADLLRQVGGTGLPIVKDAHEGDES